MPAFIVVYFPGIELLANIFRNILPALKHGPHLEAGMKVGGRIAAVCAPIDNASFKTAIYKFLKAIGWPFCFSGAEFVCDLAR